MPEQDTHKKILVAPLNWGLGHATRCIPIIKQLSALGFKVVLAGDGSSLELLKKEFPSLQYFDLPSYQITYSEKGSFLLFKLLLRMPVFFQTIKKERKVVEQLIEKEKISGIISDNRFGVMSSKVPCIFLSHQIRVLSGVTTRISSFLHRMIINRFDECWIPDQKGKNNLSGLLSDPKGLKIPVRFVGNLSRMSRNNLKKDIKWLAVLSGPEPQRSILENELRKMLPKLPGPKMLIQGIIDKETKEFEFKGIRIKNFVLSQELGDLINRAETVISRSGYSTLMDLKALRSKAIFVPTPGQTEQIYLAKRMKDLGIAFYTNQNNLCLNDFNKSQNYAGFINSKTNEELGGINQLQESILKTFKTF